MIQSYGTQPYGEEEGTEGAVVFEGVIVRTALSITARPRVHYQVSSAPAMAIAVTGHPALQSQSSTSTLQGYGLMPYGGETLASSTGITGRVSMTLAIDSEMTSVKLSEVSFFFTLEISSTATVTPEAAIIFSAHLDLTARVHVRRKGASSLLAQCNITATPTVHRSTIEVSASLAALLAITANPTTAATNSIRIALALLIVAHARVARKLHTTVGAHLSISGFASFKAPSSGLAPAVLQFYELREFVTGSVCTYPSGVLGEDASFNIGAAHEAADGDFYVCDNGLKLALDESPAVERVR